MKVEEPIAMYGTSSIPELRQRVISMVQASEDEEELRMCISLMQHEPMPCCFTEEELDEEIRLSEASGYATDEEVRQMYEQWGIVL